MLAGHETSIVVSSEQVELWDLSLDLYNSFLKMRPSLFLLSIESSAESMQRQWLIAVKTGEQNPANTHMYLIVSAQVTFYQRRFVSDKQNM